MIKMRQMTPLLFDKTITNNYYYLPMDKTHQPSHTVHYKQRQSGSMLGIGIVWNICHVNLWAKLTPMNTLVDGMRKCIVQSIVTHGSYQMMDKQKHTD